MKLSLTIAAATLPILLVAAEKHHEWLAGRVLSSDITEKFMGYVTTVPAQNAPYALPFPATTVPVWRNTRRYLLGTDKTIYLCAERGTKLNLWTGLQTTRPLLVEGSVVRFYVDGGELVVIDNDGHARRELLIMQSPRQEFEAALAHTDRPALTDREVDEGRPPERLPAARPPSREGVIDRISAGGETVVLTNGSIWRVTDVSTIRVSLWLPYTRVQIVSNENGTFTLVHMTDGETAKVERIE